jgi:hypothetical protein
MKRLARLLARWRKRLTRTWELARFRPRTFLAAVAWPLAGPAAWLWRRTWLRGTRLIAVTGSIGKTSTAAAVAAVLGVPFDPGARNFGSFLAVAVLRHRPRRQPLVLEVGISRRGQMRRYARLLRPDAVLLTAVAEDHSKALGGIEGVAAEKAWLARAVRPGGLLVVNGDDPRCRSIAASIAANTVRAGFAADCEWRIGGVRVDFPHGTQVRLDGPEASLEIASPWIGEGLAATPRPPRSESIPGSHAIQFASDWPDCAPPSNAWRPCRFPAGRGCCATPGKRVGRRSNPPCPS